LTPEEFASRFGPTEEQYQAVAAFARAHHLTVTRTHANRMLLDVAGAAADVNKSFGFHLRRYHRPGGHGEFFAPDAEPSVPEGVPILDVSGLSDYAPPHPMIRDFGAQARPDAAQPNAGSGSGGAYLGGDFRAAYAPGVSLNGSGQVVGLVEFDGFYAADITNYAGKAGLPVAPVQTVLLDEFNGVPSNGAGSGNAEVSLDIELVMSMAPGLSNIISYEAGPYGTPNDVLNRMANDNKARQLACCWTWGGGPSATTDQIFQQMAAQGQSFFCASGDSDAYTFGAMDNASSTTTPSDSPYITIVGGTTLTTSGPGGAWVSEKVWNWGNGDGSGGGTSSYYGIPTWQQGVSMSANGGSTNMRNIPDVAMAGDNIYVVYNNGSSGTFGGTSCATPLWAAFTSLVNQQAAGEGLGAVGFINPAIYALGKSVNYNSALHDITTGNNTSSGSPNAFYATTGYDLCTGWGTPNGAALIKALAEPPDPLEISPSAGFGSFGLVGGPFNTNSELLVLTNGGGQSLSWSLANTNAWLEVSAGGGTLAAGGPASAVMVSLNAAAKSLPAGVYTATLWFTNLSTGVGTSRQFVLTTSSQLIQNGGFETGTFADWNVTGDATSVSVSTSAFYVHSGAYGAQLGPYGSLSYLSQSVATVPGQAYVLSFWFDNPKAGTPNQFTASCGGLTLFSQNNLPAMGWTNLHFSFTANSASTVLQFGFRNDPAYFGLDDVSLVPVAAPGLRALAKVENVMQFSMTTTVGAVYQLQYVTDLSQRNWMNLGQPFTATNTTTLLTDTGAVDPQRFYRIIINP